MAKGNTFTSYYKTLFQRKNALKELFFGFFLSIASYPRLILEVFIRKNMGERYFNGASLITVGIILLIIPTGIGAILGLLFSRFGYRSADLDWGKFATWYMFVIGYFYFGYIRWKEVKRNPGVFDFARFSQSSGERILDPKINELWKGENKPSARFIEIYLEPLAFFVPGILLGVMGQPIGVLLLFCSLVYCLSTAAQYMRGDHFIMDKIDEMICNRELSKTFVEGVKTDTSGFKWFGPDIKDKSKRENIFDAMMDDDISMAK